MKIEDVKIEDAADANYVIRKFFNDQFKDMKMSQLEQLVLTVYNMGKNSGTSTDTESSDKLNKCEAKDSPIDPVKANPFKMSDRAKAIEDIEIGRSGEFIKEGTIGTVSSVNDDTVSFLFETDEDGEMLETSVLFYKLEKIT